MVGSGGGGREEEPPPRFATKPLGEEMGFAFQAATSGRREDAAACPGRGGGMAGTNPNSYLP